MDFQQILNWLLAGLSLKIPDLGIWTVSLAVYCIIIFHFYRFVAKRDLFGFSAAEVELERRDSAKYIFGTFFGFIKYGLLFPLIVFFWFSAFSVLMFFLAKELQTAQILLISVSFVTAIRLASYYSEDLARDMAKFFPFVLLGVAIVEPNFFSLDLVVYRFNSLQAFLPDIPVYFTFVILVEWLLRVILALKHLLCGVAKKNVQEPAQ